MKDLHDFRLRNYQNIADIKEDILWHIPYKRIQNILEERTQTYSKTDSNPLINLDCF